MGVKHSSIPSGASSSIREHPDGERPADHEELPEAEKSLGFSICDTRFAHGLICRGGVIRFNFAAARVTRLHVPHSPCN